MAMQTGDRERVQKRLAAILFKKLYLDSRETISKIVKDTAISHHTISKYLREYEQKYDLSYTLDIDPIALGFSEERILAIKFDDPPKIELLKKVLGNDIYVQNAYLSNGDFDLIIHVLGPNTIEYGHWEFKLRVGFSKYKPKISTSVINHTVEGFLPIKSKIINKSKNINATEKTVLGALIKNSRTRLKDLEKLTNLSQMQVLYTMKKLKKDGKIKKFSTLVQNTNKKMFLFYGITYTPNINHHRLSLLPFMDGVINAEKENDITTDYSIICDTSGHFDSVYFCNFADGQALNERGALLLKETWKAEQPEFKQCILTELVTGKWPFNKNGYYNWKRERDNIINKPVKFDLYQ